MTYSDGSWYDGDWNCGLRHGVGEFHKFTDGRRTVYRGQWLNDLKHGIGEEQYPEKKFGKYDSVKGIWLHNSMNGVAKLQEKSCCCPAERDIVYKDNLYIDMTRGQITFEFYCYALLSLAAQITVLVFAGKEDLGPVIGGMLIYYIMSYLSSATNYIWNTMDL